MAKAQRRIDISFLAHNVRKQREAKGYSMQALANLAEIEKSQISRIEYGESDPRLSTVILIANALGITLEEILAR